MAERPLSEEERQTLKTLRWRRAGFAAWFIFVWATLVWLVALFPIARAAGASLRTSYGLLRWLVVVDTGGYSVHRTAATITFIVCGAITLFVAAYAHRTFRNLTPRWQCSNCGFIVRGGFPRNNLCPECGELPNLRKEPWAFWRW
jgi:hypothetical protein